jgi:hypothetical protein
MAPAIVEKFVPFAPPPVCNVGGDGARMNAAANGQRTRLTVNGDVDGDGSGTLDEVTNGTYAASKFYDIIKTDVGNSHTISNSTFTSFEYDGTDPNPLGLTPNTGWWRHKSHYTSGGQTGDVYYLDDSSAGHL